MIRGLSGVVRATCIAGIALCAADLRAQSYFGKNQVQFDHFDWQVIETEHFYIHYYPAEALAAHDAARMTERAYGRLSRLMGHEFREKKPVVFYASRADFGQNNVTGDLGEGVGGVTEALRHRILLPFTGDYASFEQVLTHEMVHAFQYDIFARGKAGGGLQRLRELYPPLWFTEGMAEYLSIGPYHPHTATWVRDAALNSRLPTIRQMTDEPERFFPYRYGEAFWAYIGQRWGDEVIGPIMQAATVIGYQRAFRRELGMTLDELSSDWRLAMEFQHLPRVAELDRARAFSNPLLSEKRSGGEIFLAPSLSPDGRYIAFLSNGSFARGEVFIDLWLGDGRTGKRIKRLVKSTVDPNAEELRLLYSQSSFSPDGRYLAYTAQRKGRDVLYILDVERRTKTSRIDLPLEGVTGPSWSPDAKKLVFSGHVGGTSDLYVVDITGSNFRRLTNDRYGDQQPQWSPDGKTIAFASDRGSITDFNPLRFARWSITLYHLEDARIEVLPNQDGLNINPVWGPDGKVLAYVSSRTGIQNVFLFDFADREHYQLTNVAGGVTAITEYSPAITWAHRADRIAFTYLENGDYTVWSVDNPRSLKRAPFRGADDLRVRGLVALGDTIGVVRSGTGAGNGDSASQGAMLRFRLPAGVRPTGGPPTATDRGPRRTMSVAAILDSVAFSLPDTTRFKRYAYRTRFSPDYVARPSIGYTSENSLGRGVFGGTTIVLSDLLGNHSLAFSGEVNGSFADARAFAAWTNLSRRLQYSMGVYQTPLYHGQAYRFTQPRPGGVGREELIYTRYLERQAFGISLYPLNRFTRFEGGVRLSNVQRADIFVGRSIDAGGRAEPFRVDSTRNTRTVNYAQPYVAFVSDNVLFGYVAPIMGRRFRLQAEPTYGSFRVTDFLADYRRYDPIIFNTITVATRALAVITTGRDSDSLRKYIGFPDLVRGYHRNSFPSGDCFDTTSAYFRCSPLIGSRIALASAEVRFPLLRPILLRRLPIPLPPVEGELFYDAAVAWFAGQDVRITRGQTADPRGTRSLLTSHGLGLRMNLFNFAVLRWDYVWPHDAPVRKPFWQFSLGPSY